MQTTEPSKLSRPLHLKKVDVIRTAFRKMMLVLLTAAPVLAAEPAQDASDPYVHAGFKPPLHGLEEVGYQDVQLKGGFWGPRLEIHHKIFKGQNFKRYSQEKGA